MQRALTGSPQVLELSLKVGGFPDFLQVLFPIAAPGERSHTQEGGAAMPKASSFLYMAEVICEGKKVLSWQVQCLIMVLVFSRLFSLIHENYVM